MSDIKNMGRRIWSGRVASAVVVMALLADASRQLFFPALAGPMLAEGGFDPALAPIIGAIMLLCAALYALPATAMFGAIVTTGFLGGAICTHVRLGELASLPQLVSLLLGVLAWGGLYLREPRLRALLPMRERPLSANLYAEACRVGVPSFETIRI